MFYYLIPLDDVAGTIRLGVSLDDGAKNPPLLLPPLFLLDFFLFLAEKKISFYTRNNHFTK